MVKNFQIGKFFQKKKKFFQNMSLSVQNDCLDETKRF